MTAIVLSPHTDDAIFSIALKLKELDDVTIITPFAGVPEDESGKIKHTILREEHQKACESIGAKFINGDFLDDVYGLPNRKDVAAWLQSLDLTCDELYIPIGIHHPDHLLTSNLMIALFNQFHINSKFIFFYEEQPYADNYPELLEIRRRYIANAVGSMDYTWVTRNSWKRKEAISSYESQVKNGLLDKLADAEERIWKLAR